MKTRNLIFCLLFLFLGTTIAWADKYYKPKTYRGATTTPRLTLEQALGKKFMIYDAAINGNEDRTGFLRCDGTKFAHDKSKERDNYVYNESFVYTMEKYTEGEDVYYAIKSVQTGTYVNINGNFTSSLADAKLYITDWENATNKSDANLEDWQYNIVANGSIASGGHATTVHVIKNGDTHWNGLINGFTTWGDGHPYAFHEAHEVTDDGNEYDYLTNLHIYSRCDIYSAQAIYGLVQSASQITTNHPYDTEGDVSYLYDGDNISYSVTNWQENTANDYHYYQIDLGKPVSELYIYMQRRADGLNAPTKFELQVSETPNGEFTTVGGERTTTLGTSVIYSSNLIELGGNYQYIRIVAKETTTPDYKCMGFSELYFLPNTHVINDALTFVTKANSGNAPMYTKATARAYEELMEEYEATCPEAKLLSGVPLPGNKYRIYADAYDMSSGVFVNQDIKTDINVTSLSLATSTDSYEGATADEKKTYEWYCEKTSDGHLVFRSVADPNKYLGYNEISTTPYLWSISTVGTQRHGVSLINYSNQCLAVGYTLPTEEGQLAVGNTGFWMGGVSSPQDQTQVYNYTDNNNTPDDETDDTPAVIQGGVCTDFVFLPVELAGTEKKITFVANGLVCRNTKFLFDADNNGTAEQQTLPYARMFVSETKYENIRVELLCSDVHQFTGVKVNGVLNSDAYNREDDNISFNWEAVNDGDVLEIYLEIKEPFITQPSTFSTTQTPALYFIRNKHRQGVQQQARPYRAIAIPDIDIDIEGDDEGDEPISQTSGKFYYAKFNQRNANMLLVDAAENNPTLDATSLFYFTVTEDDDVVEYYNVNIQNATTVMKCADQALWSTNGNSWYVQPKQTTGSRKYTGYNIGRTILNATNNPKDAWCSNHDDGAKILTHYSNDDGAAWEFIKVDDDVARQMLKDFIDKVAGELDTILDEKEANAARDGYDTERIDYYRFIIETMQVRAAKYFDNQMNDGNDPTAKLLQFAQNIHMVEHEIEYALYELPLLTDETKMDEANGFSDPHWYYVKNVNAEKDKINDKGDIVRAGDTRYATHEGDEDPMSLKLIDEEEANAPKLSNLFYFVGEENSYDPIADNDPSNDAEYTDNPGNNLIIDEYLKVHIHNFKANEKTLVSKNVQLSKNDAPINPGQGKQTVVSGLNLKSDEDWSLVLEYNIDPNYAPYNAYGSCLLSSSSDPLKNTYNNEFQVYLKDNRSIVIKVNNGDDRYQFWHTQDYFTNIKVVITYSQKTVTLDVYNSIGEKETKIVADGDSVTLNDISKLYSALPADGTVITTLETYQVEEMTWKTHEESLDGTGEKDQWYILPSSNLNNLGFAIVLEEPNDTKMGWSNKLSENKSVTTDLGTADNSTWKFVRVTDFEGHMQELLDLWNLDECTVYHAPLVEVYEKLQALYANAKASGIYDEVTFNKMVAAIREYNGLAKEEFFAPKADKLYTVRPAVTKGEYVNGMSVDADNQLKKTAAFEYVTKSSQSPIPGRTYYVYANATKTGKTWYLYDNGTGLGIAEDKVTDNPAYMWTCIDAGDGKFSLQNGNGKYLANGNNYYLSLGNTAAEYKMDNGSLVNQANYDGGKHMVTKANGSIANTNYNSLFNRNSGATNQDWCSFYIFVDCDEVPEYDSNAVWSFEGIARDTQANTVGASIKSLHTQCYISTLDAQKTTLTNAGAMILKPLGSSVVSIVFDGNYLTRDEADAAGVYLTGGAEVEAPDNNGVKDVYSPVTSWVVEEVADCESIRYKRTVGKQGHGTLMLGFDAKIPDGIEAFYPRQYGDIADVHYMSMKSYDGGILPANSPVLLKIEGVSSQPGEFDVNANYTQDFKFYYSATQPTEQADNLLPVLFGALYNTNVRCAYYREDWEYADPKNRIYMMQANKTEPRLYQIWENRTEDGTKLNPSETHDGGYVRCSANMAYWVLPYGDDSSTPANAKYFSLSYKEFGTTDIEDIVAEGDAADVEVVESIYDLQGRKLDEITEPGIYIVNGKKVIVK